MIYVASSWRNPFQQVLISHLEREGYDVYDFRHPASDNEGFRWSEIDEGWQGWTHEQYVTALNHPIATRGFGYDMTALVACTTCLLLLPCGRSSHLELGYAVGSGKHTLVYYPSGVHIEPELMYKMVGKVCLSLEEVLRQLLHVEKQ